MNLNIKHILLAVTLLASIHLNAQSKWAGGYRTGFELINLNNNKEESIFTNDNSKWINELFIIRKLTNRFEIDAAFRYGSKTYIDTFVAFDGPNGIIAQKQQFNQLSLQLSTRYHILNRTKYTIYGQLGTAILKPVVHTDVVINTLSKEPEYYSSTEGWKTEWFNSINIGAGCNYNLTDKFNIAATFITTYKTAVGMNIGQHSQYSDWSANALLGLGYRF